MTKIHRWGRGLLMLCLVAVILLAQPVRASEAESDNTTLTALVRRAAAFDAAPIGRLAEGTVVTVLGSTQYFYQIDCYDMIGYIAQSQVTYENEKYTVTCDPDSGETTVFTYTDRSQALSMRHSLYALARKQLGKPYIYGSTGMQGFDCSGLMMYLYKEHGIELHRTASQQLQDGMIIPREQLQVGDMVFFHESWDSYPASHVGIYVGNNQIIHASSSRGVVYDNLDTQWFAGNYLCARRIVDTGAASIEKIAVPVTTTVGATGRRVN